MAERQIARLSAWPVAGLLLVLALQATLVTGRSINWDEFFHYSQIHNLANGTLTGPLQTLYTRAFLWVLDRPGSGIDHIVTIRWFMLGTELVTLAAIIGIGRRFASPPAAWLCALAWLGAGYVFQHGTAFRFDPPATALLISAAWIMLARPLRTGWILAIGLLIGIATILTIKSVLYAPVFAGIAWLRWTEGGRNREMLLRLAATALAVAAGCAVVYWLHASNLSGPADSAAKATLGQASGKMFSLTDLPYWRHHLKGAAIAPLVTLMVLAFPFVLAGSTRVKAEKIALAGLFAPLATLLFYHNTAPYYFVFMLAPVCAALVVVMERALARYSQAAIAIIMVLLAIAVWAMEKPAVIETQRQLTAAAEVAFPGHPAYFDACAMLGAFPKANVFMTPVGLTLYRQGHYPAMAATLAERPVPLVVSNDPVLDSALASINPVPELLPDDLNALRESYVPFWGPFWVAGRAIDQAGDWSVRVPGQYRVEGGDLLIDGRLLRDGQSGMLPRGHHQVEPLGAAKVRLVWAEAVLPPGPSPSPPYFVDF